jgi:hypothetical protein
MTSYLDEYKQLFKIDGVTPVYVDGRKEAAEIEVGPVLTENEEKHLGHPFYADVNQYRETVRREQILKGAHKYPEPFTTASWTNQQIIDHAMQENVDQAHYIYAALERFKQYEKECAELVRMIEVLTNERDEWKQEAKLAHEEIKKMAKQRDEWKKQHIKDHTEIQDLQYKLKVAESGQVHDCSKNQVIVWENGNGRRIKKIHCAECNKTLYEA